LVFDMFWDFTLGSRFLLICGDNCREYNHPVMSPSFGRALKVC
jgi:hypothetical protein